MSSPNSYNRFSGKDFVPNTPHLKNAVGLDGHESAINGMMNTAVIRNLLATDVNDMREMPLSSSPSTSGQTQSKTIDQPAYEDSDDKYLPDWAKSDDPWGQLGNWS